MKHASVVALALLALAAVASAQTISGCEDVSNADLISLQTGILTCLSVDLDNDNSVCPGTCSNALEELDSACLNGLINYAVDNQLTSTSAADLTERLDRLVNFCGLSFSEEESDDLVAGEDQDLEEAEAPVSAPVTAPAAAPEEAEEDVAAAPGPSVDGSGEDDTTVEAQDSSPSPSPSSAAAGRGGLVAAALAIAGALVVLV